MSRCARGLAFVLGVFVLDAALSWAIGWSYARSPLTSFMRQNKTILYFGDSKFHFGVDPDITGKPLGLDGYNLAREGGGIVYSKGIQSVLLRRSRPKLLVLQVMDFSTEKAAEGRLAPFLDEPGVARVFQKLPTTVRLQYSVLRSARYNWVFPSLAKSWFVPPPTSSSGFSELHGNKPHQPPAPTPALRESERRLYTSLLDAFFVEARQHEVPVVVVEMPLKEGRRSPFYATYRELAQRHGAPFLDFSRQGAHSIAISPESFYDEGHLNARGAALFSAALGQRLSQALNPKEHAA